MKNTTLILPIILCYSFCNAQGDKIKEFVDFKEGITVSGGVKPDTPDKPERPDKPDKPDKPEGHATPHEAPRLPAKPTNISLELIQKIKARKQITLTIAMMKVINDIFSVFNKNPDLQYQSSIGLISEFKELSELMMGLTKAERGVLERDVVNIEFQLMERR
jgi:hypothetical protein